MHKQIQHTINSSFSKKFRKKSATSIFAFILLLSMQFISAQEFTTKVSKTTLGENERLRIQFTIDKQGADNFKPPDFTNFIVVAGPMQSTNFQYINGKQSFEKSFTYTIKPKAKGVFTIAAATATYQGKVIRSNKIKITVVKGKTKTKVQLENDPEIVATKNIFLVAEVSNTNPFVGESINIVYKLYMDQQNAAVSDEQESKSPIYNGFWKQNIEIKRLTQKKGNYKGNEMTYYILRKDVLIPQQTGKLKLSPLKIDVAANVAYGKPRRDFFGRIVRGQKRVNLSLSSGYRTITVKPLPITGKPANFEGAVGNFNFKIYNSKSVLKTNESTQVTVELNGKGNLKLISLPKIETPKGLEQYEPEHKDVISTNLSGLSGYIKDTYTIVPQYRGKYIIPSVSFSYFNPKLEKYQIINTNKIVINVPEGKMPVEDENINVKSNNVITDNDIRAIHTKTALVTITTKEDFFKSNLFYLLLLLPMLSIPIGMFLGNKKQQRNADVIGNKRRKANRLAKKYLSNAKKELGNKEPFYIALEKALHNYLKAKLQIETSEISKEKISVLLKNKSVNEQTINKFIKVLNDCDFARYTPSSNVEMKNEYNNAADIITELDKVL